MQKTIEQLKEDIKDLNMQNTFWCVLARRYFFVLKNVFKVEYKQLVEFENPNSKCCLMGECYGCSDDYSRHPLLVEITKCQKDDDLPADTKRAFEHMAKKISRSK